MPVCKTCRRPIKWYVTASGAKMPVDPEPKPDGNVVLRGLAGDELRLAHVLREGEQPFDGEPRFSCHFETCPKAETHRRRRRTAA